MPHIVAALFDSQSQAQRALQALLQTGVAQDRIAVLGDDPGNEVSSISGFRELSARDDTLVELHDLPLPQDDLDLFESGLRRGGALLCARVDRSDLDVALRVLDMFDPIDVDRHSEEWLRRSGTGGQAGVTGENGSNLAAGLTAGTCPASTNTESSPGMGAMADDPSVLGTSDLRTDESSLSDQGRSTVATGRRGGRNRADAPGALELAPESGAQKAAAPRSGPGGPIVSRVDCGAGAFRRDATHAGRVRTYSSD
jgi:hypothetical protein